MPAPRVAVAASGGRDSTALLHCTQRLAREVGIDVLALHVHHGLMAEADGWLQHVRRQCRRWGAVFVCRRLSGAPPAGQSIEAWARSMRYAALAEMAAEQGCRHVLLAHHRQDQAETFLLQALRGGGAAGLAAMPAVAARQGIVWLRPWLDQPSAAIDAYVRRHRLAHVQDPSNAQRRFARSRLRHTVWPALVAAFGDAETTLAAAARQAQDALALAQEAAAADLSVLVCDGAAGDLLIEPWLQLPPARRKNALRAWLQQAGGGAVPHTLLARLLQELPTARAARWPCAGGELRLHRGRLAWMAQPWSGPATAAPLVAPLVAQPLASLPLDLSRPGRVAMPGWPGHWSITAARSGGILPSTLQQVLALPRCGGERLRLHAAGHARSLKKQYQALAVPAWQRDGPLLYTAQGRLLFVPGLGADAAFLAAPGRPQRRLQWCVEIAPQPGAEG